MNFARSVEGRYGLDALHPRLAAQREGVVRVATVGAVYEIIKTNRGRSDSADRFSADLSPRGELTLVTTECV